MDALHAEVHLDGRLRVQPGAAIQRSHRRKTFCALQRDAADVDQPLGQLGNGQIRDRRVDRGHGDPGRLQRLLQLGKLWGGEDAR